MKIIQADGPTIQIVCHPSRLVGAPTSSIPTIFTPDALPSTTLPIYPGLGQSPNMLACIPGGLVRRNIHPLIYVRCCATRNITAFSGLTD